MLRRQQQQIRAYIEVCGRVREEDVGINDAPNKLDMEVMSIGMEAAHSGTDPREEVLVHSLRCFKSMPHAPICRIGAVEISWHIWQ